MEVIIAKHDVDANGQHELIVVVNGQSLHITISATALANRLAKHQLADEKASLEWIIRDHIKSLYAVDPASVKIATGTEADIPAPPPPVKTAKQVLAAAVDGATTLAQLKAALLEFARN